MLIKQPYHIVEKSPWALITSFRVLRIATGLVVWFFRFNYFLFFISYILTSLLAYQWWRDISWEGSSQGHHTRKVVTSLYLRIIFFILSEVCFFFSFFWRFFHRRLSRNMELGFFWPPVGIIAFDPYSIPLLNRIILLSSGVSVTWAHHSIMEKDFNNFVYGILVTVGLGVYFRFLQKLEYEERFFSIRDSVYGRVFFVATGFHGLHVLIGRIFLLINLIRSIKGSMNSDHHVGLELRIWYWHFVDVVWLFLYIFIYWWGF